MQLWKQSTHTVQKGSVAREGISILEASLPSQLAEKNRTNSRVVEDQAKKCNDNPKNERKSIEQKEQKTDL